MKRTRLMKIIHILAILLAVGCQLLAVGSHAQISSSAFDPNCYQPVIGTPGVIDTIYGSYYQEQLGSFVKNLWQAKGESYGKIVIDSGRNSYLHSVTPLFESGPSFNLHKLVSKDTFNLGYLINPRNLVKKGHFRSHQYMDALFTIPDYHYPPRIYWANDQGKYDSTRYTELRSPITGINGVDYDDEMSTPYVTYLSSDSLDDIISSITLDNKSLPLDSSFFLFFKGGNSLYNQGKLAYADSFAFFYTFQTGGYRACTQGDFRGVGREDLIALEGNGNDFFYKNDTPFSLQKFIYAMKYDTLMSQWQNPKGNSWWGLEPQLVMHAFNKPLGDSSMDFLPVNGNVGEIHIYKGGPDFGSQRLQEDQADFILHTPDFYDSKWNGVNLGGTGINCGKLSGTNNNVLWRSGDLDGGFYGYDFFYVLGDAMDSKVDMYYYNDFGFGASGGVDTLTADNDKIQDVIIGKPWYGKDNGNEMVGTVLLVHGSNKIPNKSNSVIARKSVDESPFHILAIPNPCNEHTVLTFDNCSASKMQLQVIASNGTIVLQDETPVVDGLQDYGIDLSPLAAGNYIINLSCPSPGWSSSVNVVKTGTAVKPWSINLKGMVGR
jgi:hypothetical protein